MASLKWTATVACVFCAIATTAHSHENSSSWVTTSSVAPSTPAHHPCVKIVDSGRMVFDLNKGAYVRIPLELDCSRQFSGGMVFDPNKGRFIGIPIE